MTSIIKVIRPSHLCILTAGVIFGIMISAAGFQIDLKVALLLLLSAFALQCVFDFSDHVWYRRVAVALTVALVCAMASCAFGTVFSIESFVMMAMVYFMSRIVHGYSAGRVLSRRRLADDILTALFYGPVVVYFSHFVCTHTVGTWLMILPSAAIGILALSHHVEGESKAVDVILVLTGFAFMTAYSCLRMYDIWHFLYLLSLPLFFIGKSFRPYAVLVFSILAGAGFLVFLL